MLLWLYAVRKGWLAGFDRRFPAILLDLVPNVYSLSVFLGALAVVPWKPAVAQVLWTSAFGAPLVSRILSAVRAKRARHHPE
jgi:hypothetical protein